MIYVLEFKERALAETEGAKFIIMSGDGTQAMVQSDKPLTLVTPSSEYSDSEKDALLASQHWLQPCFNCGE